MSSSESTSASLHETSGRPPERGGPLGGQAVILASASPRRAELLRQIGIDFEVRLPDAPVDETPRSREAPADYVVRLATEKAAAVACAASGRVVLAADTTVVLDDCILGKPRDANDAVEMLLALQGRHHEVLTGIAVRRDADGDTRLASTRVWFRAIGRAEAESYWLTGEATDKAGGYGIQGVGAIFAETLQGSYSTVVGLPLVETERLLRDFGVDTWAMRRGGRRASSAPGGRTS